MSLIMIEWDLLKKMQKLTTKNKDNLLGRGCNPLLVMTNVLNRRWLIIHSLAKPQNFGDCHDDGYDNHQTEDKGEREDDTNIYDYGVGVGGDNDKAVDVPWSILSPFAKPQCLRNFFSVWFSTNSSNWKFLFGIDDSIFVCSNSTLKWKKLYVWPQQFFWNL